MQIDIADRITVHYERATISDLRLRQLQRTCGAQRLGLTRVFQMQRPIVAHEGLLNLFAEMACAQHRPAHTCRNETVEHKGEKRAAENWRERLRFFGNDC